MCRQCFPSQRDEMRGNQCAINSPRFTATSSRGLFRRPRPLLASPRSLLRARLKHSCQPARRPADSTSDCPTAILLAKNYFNLLSYPVSLLPRSTVPPSIPPSFYTSGSLSARSSSNPTAGMDLLALFRDLFSPGARRDLWRRVY